MCPATTHVEKVVAVIITTLTLNIVQLGLISSVSNKQLPVGGASRTLHTLDTRSYKGKLLDCTIKTDLHHLYPVNILMELYWPSFIVHSKALAVAQHH